MSSGKQKILGFLGLSFIAALVFFTSYQAREKTAAKIRLEKKQETQELIDARRAHIAEKRKSGAILTISVDQKPFSEVSQTQFAEMVDYDYQAVNSREKQGISLANFFKKKGIVLGPQDEITIAGRGKSTFRFSEIVSQEIGLMLTRKGTPKLVARQGKLKIPHVRTIEIAHR